MKVELIAAADTDIATADTVGCCWEEQISPGGKFTHDDLPCPPLSDIYESGINKLAIYLQLVMYSTADTVGCCWEEQISPGGKFTHDDLPCPPLSDIYESGINPYIYNW
ncbi:hypothetical protein L249_4504 [Ophiocordyceps polyrhachis-furcata BCC 54312]|uniref:Uncharacterized protein n=1 Tax=Ophiocordyceps polyrhachis-furcata BCC 54312 TaxID=1330021 RepID=A0A367KZ07_9HYPO|nr:hypothetical protein L249_4504 [Ophiocordyceps polyrhachis-furcata BCC 54312]